jgi:cation:H+ antiporter
LLLSVVILVVGLALLVLGGDQLVRHASALAARLGVPPVLIGLTVVAFGTSTPELVVNLTAAFKGSGEIAFGNIIGSNIANIGLLLGFSAVLSALTVHRTLIRREIPMMVLTCGVALVQGLDVWLDDGADMFSRADGLVMLMLFGVFLYYTVNDALGSRDAVGNAEASAEVETVAAHKPVWFSCVMILVALAMLIVGGDLTVRGATKLAQAMGVSEALIGLTIVAVGTSLPELATCIAAVRRRQPDLVIGNIVGSNLYNLLFVLGLSATITPVSIPSGSEWDLVVMIAFSLLLLPLAASQKTISRIEGAVLLIGYVGYVAWLAMR